MDNNNQALYQILALFKNQLFKNYDFDEDIQNQLYDSLNELEPAAILNAIKSNLQLKKLLDLFYLNVQPSRDERRDSPNILDKILSILVGLDVCASMMIIKDQSKIIFSSNIGNHEFRQGFVKVDYLIIQKNENWKLPNAPPGNYSITRFLIQPYPIVVLIMPKPKNPTQYDIVGPFTTNKETSEFFEYFIIQPRCDTPRCTIHVPTIMENPEKILTDLTINSLSADVKKNPVNIHGIRPTGPIELHSDIFIPLALPPGLNSPTRHALARRFLEANVNDFVTVVKTKEFKTSAILTAIQSLIELVGLITSQKRDIEKINKILRRILKHSLCREVLKKLMDIKTTTVEFSMSENDFYNFLLSKIFISNVENAFVCSISTLPLHLHFFVPTKEQIKKANQSNSKLKEITRIMDKRNNDARNIVMSSLNDCCTQIQEFIIHLRSLTSASPLNEDSEIIRQFVKCSSQNITVIDGMPNTHTEMRILEYFDQQEASLPTSYLAISKPSCYMCNHILACRRFSTKLVRGTYGTSGLFENWGLPRWIGPSKQFEGLHWREFLGEDLYRLYIGLSWNDQFIARYYIVNLGKYQNALKIEYDLKSKSDSPVILVQKMRESLLSSASASPDLTPSTSTWITAQCPAMLDLAGSWSDSPTFCYEHNAAVCNVAVLVNGGRPIGARVRPFHKPVVMCTFLERCPPELCDKTTSGVGHSSAGNEECHCLVFSEMNKFSNSNYIGSLLKACLLYTKIISDETELPLSEQLGASLVGGSAGLEVELWIDLPPSSGLGEHGVLTAALLSVLWRVIGKMASRCEIINGVLKVQQLCSSFYGYQEQVGAVYGGIKLATSHAANPPQISTWYLGHAEIDALTMTCNDAGAKLQLNDSTDEVAISKSGINYSIARAFDDFENRLVLIHTGPSQRCKDILLKCSAERNSVRAQPPSSVMDSLKVLAYECFLDFLWGDLSAVSLLTNKYWELKSSLAPDCEFATFIRDVLLSGPTPVLSCACLAGTDDSGFIYGLLAPGASREYLRDCLSAVIDDAEARIFTAQVDYYGLLYS